MGKTQSKDCADKKGTDNLSAESEVNDIDIMQQLAENEGPIAVFAYIENNLNRWTREQVKFAITGRSGTGKSTFINTIRNVKPEDDGFAMTGSGDTTTQPTLYMHPTNDQITFCDLPGYASANFKKVDYISEMKIADYDFVLIFFINVLSEDEIWLSLELEKLGKHFALVRTMIDVDINNAKNNGKDKKMIIPEIKERIETTLNKFPELMKTKGIFLISSTHPNLGEWSDLMAYVEENIDGIKAQALLSSLACITKNMVERKYKMLKKRLVRVTAAAGVIAAIPVPFIDAGINIIVLANEVRHYMSVFGINRENVYSLENFDHSLLRCTTLLRPNLNMIVFVSSKLATYSGLLLATSVFDLIVPLIGSVISSATTAAMTYNFLDNMLQNMKHDAVLIYEHISTTDVDQRT